MFRIEFILIINMYFTAITISEDLEIFRVSSDGDEGWQQGTDSFKIPSSLCDQDKSDSINCARFSADVKSGDGERCFCSCPNGDATLMFSNNEWRCLKNDNVRVLLGYNRLTYTAFDEEDNDNELRMLNISDRRPLSLAPWAQCLVDQDSSLYIGCDGSDVPFRSSLFTIQKANKGTPFFIKVNEGVSDAQFLRGRIIKLGIRCLVINNIFIRQRLLFKYEGKITCPIPRSSVQPSLTTKSLNTTTKLSPSATTVTTRNRKNSTTVPLPVSSIVFTTVYGIPRTVSVSSMTVSYTPSAVTRKSSTVSDTPPTVPDIMSTISYTSLPVFVVPTPVSSVVYSTSPTSTNTPAIFSEVQPTISDTPPTAFVPSPSTQDTMTVSPFEVLPRPSPGRQRITENNNSSSLSLGLIVGLPASFSAVVFFFGVLVYRFRHKESNPSSNSNGGKRKATVIMSAQPNSGYELDDNSAYEEVDFRKPPIYASTHEEPYLNSETQFSDNDSPEDHTYAPLNFSDDQNIQGHGSTQEHLYRTLENPGFDNVVKSRAYVRNIRPISMEQPLYNLIEEFSVPREDGHRQDVDADQEEEPYLKPIDSDGSVHYKARSTEEPVYNTLEELYKETQ